MVSDVQWVDLGADVCCLCFGLVGTLDVTTASRLYDRFGHACMTDACWPCQFDEWVRVRFRGLRTVGGWKAPESAHCRPKSAQLDGRGQAAVVTAEGRSLRPERPRSGNEGRST